MLISIACLIVALYQCIELFTNYNAKETIRKSTEVFFHGDIPTPQIIVCTDPPHHDTENKIIKIAKDDDEMPPVRNLKTLYKVDQNYSFHFNIVIEIGNLQHN